MHVCLWFHLVVTRLSSLGEENIWTKKESEATSRVTSRLFSILQPHTQSSKLHNPGNGKIPFVKLIPSAMSSAQRPSKISLVDGKGRPLGSIDVDLCNCTVSYLKKLVYKVSMLNNDR